jgi:hypothetical protein
MASQEEIQGLIEAVGPRVEAVQAVGQTSDTEWAVLFDDDTTVMLDLVPGQQKLVLSIDLGRPAPESRLATYETMLAYNVLWQETGGVKMGLGGTNGRLVQMFELSTASLDLDLMARVLEGFVAKALVWREQIAQGAVSAEAMPPPALMREMYIRG